jgi:hypothetical protein
MFSLLLSLLANNCLFGKNSQYIVDNGFDITVQFSLKSVVLNGILNTFDFDIICGLSRIIRKLFTRGF